MSPASTAAPVGSIQTRFVGDLTERFYVPDYQRGYRWTSLEVRRLMDDISQSTQPRYYLQPIVVRPMGDGQYELVDGQQRLTSLALVYHYLREAGYDDRDRFSLDYQTRPDMKLYLQNPDAIEDSKNIDEGRVQSAYQTIKDWFARSADATPAKIKEALDTRVAVIWYELPEGEDSIDIFTRLNVGQIPLTDAELVKAQLLTAFGDERRQYQVAAEWDAIEVDIWDPEKWAFVTGGHRADATHISLLFDSLANLIADPQKGPRPTYHTFETLRTRISENPDDFWFDVRALHAQLTGWFEDRDLYHWIGFLLVSGYSLDKLIESSKGNAKSKFRHDVRRTIKNRVNLTRSEVEELTYDRNRRELQNLLFLFNVESARRAHSARSRFSFAEYVRGDWSLEHIHAQNLTTVPTAASQSASVRVVYTEPSGTQPSGTQGSSSQIFEDAAGTPTLDDPELHWIGNLALLSSADNLELSNYSFSQKQQMVIEWDKRAGYIPTCTRNVFLKYYSSPDSGRDSWTVDDQKAYAHEIIETLKPFLRAEDGDQGEDGSQNG